jgi:hypothetical protein
MSVDDFFKGGFAMDSEDDDALDKVSQVYLVEKKKTSLIEYMITVYE